MERWLKLLLATLLIGFAIWKIPAQLHRLKMYREVVLKSQELEVDNSALFYSEEAMTYQLERELRFDLKKNPKSQE